MMFSSRIALMSFVSVIACQSAQAGLNLGTAADFAVLAGSTVTNTGSSVIGGGDLGVSAGTSITGFPPGTLVSPYSFHASDAISIQAHNDLAAAYGLAIVLSPTQSMTGQDLGGLTLTPGVYFFASSAQLTGTLTLNNEGDTNAQFIFLIGSNLTTSSDSSVVSINGSASSGSNIFWAVGDSATIGIDTALEGHLMALNNITLTTGATILDGSAMAMNGAVTLDTNQIQNGANTVPEPSTMILTVIGGSLMVAGRTHQSKRRNSSVDRSRKLC